MQREQVPTNIQKREHEGVLSSHHECKQGADSELDVLRVLGGGGGCWGGVLRFREKKTFGHFARFVCFAPLLFSFFPLLLCHVYVQLEFKHKELAKVKKELEDVRERRRQVFICSLPFYLLWLVTCWPTSKSPSPSPQNVSCT
jgi:hypothetical protein